MEQFTGYFETIIQAMFSEAFAFSFLLGALLFLVGIGFLLLFAISRFTGKRVPGTVVGAVMRRKIKIKKVDGQEKEKIKETLYPVFEYEKSDGTLHRERSSEGGSSTLKYVTGQTVNLIVREDDEYDDVYDADSLGALYAGLILAIIGLAVMAQVGSMASALGIGLFSLVLVTIVRISAALLHKNNNKPNREKEKYSKAFDPEDLKPIEFFQKQRPNS